MNSKFKLRKFLNGLKYGLIVEIIIIIIYSIILIIFNSISNFSFDLLSLLSGSILLIIAGIIGPGKYSSNLDLILYYPKNGASFIDQIPIAAFTINDNIKEAKIMINGSEVKTIQFFNNIANTVIPKELIKPDILNSIQLESNSKKSNRSVFTFYDPSNLPKNTKNAKQDESSNIIDILIKEREQYNSRVNSSMGYISLSFGALALINFIFGYLFEIII